MAAPPEAHYHRHGRRWHQRSGGGLFRTQNPDLQNGGWQQRHGYKAGTADPLCLCLAALFGPGPHRPASGGDCDGLQESLQARVQPAAGRQAVQVGGTHEACCQVVVVLTREWTVLCFDYKLKLLWRNNVQQSVKAECAQPTYLPAQPTCLPLHHCVACTPRSQLHSLPHSCTADESSPTNPAPRRFPTNLFIREVAILVDSTAIQKGDAGSVFVGGSMSHDRETSTYRHPAPSTQHPAPCPCTQPLYSASARAG